MAKYTAWALVMVLAGCSQILGLDDPKIATGWDGDAAAAIRPDASESAHDRPDARPPGPRCLDSDPACAAGTTCDFAGADDDVGPTCRPAGTVAAGGLCAGPDDCAASTTCLRGVCRSLCVALDACAKEVGEGTCALSSGPSDGKGWPRFCDSPCSFLPGQADASCGAGKACAPGWGNTTCVARTQYGRLDEGVPCKDDSECLPGLTCDSYSGGVCRRYCDRDTPACTAGRTCGFIAPAWEIDMVAYGKRYGVCRP